MSPGSGGDAPSSSAWKASQEVREIKVGFRSQLRFELQDDVKNLVLVVVCYKKRGLRASLLKSLWHVEKSRLEALR